MLGHHPELASTTLVACFIVVCSACACSSEGARLEPSRVDGSVGGPGPICGGILPFQSCTGGVCHHAGQGRARGLDLQSPGIASRLVGVPATCKGRLYIDGEHPERSFILEKVSS